MLHRLISWEAFLDKIHHKGEGNWDSQYGFTKCKSCLTNQIAVLDKIFKFVDVDEELIVNAIYISFSKALDSFTEHSYIQVKMLWSGQVIK